jgi:TonB family protein
MKTNPGETIDETAAVYPLKIRANRPLRRSALLASGLLLLALGGGAGPVAWGATDQTAANAYELSQLDQIPVPRYQAKPVYPSTLSHAGVTGEATVGFIVDSAGNVCSAYAVKSTLVEFGAAAVEAVNKWKFRPGQKGGIPVNTRMQVPIVFALAKGAPGAPNQSSTGKLQPFSVTEDKDASPKDKTN